MTTQQDATREMEAALRGLDYPAPRAKLLSIAYLNGASPEVVSRLMERPETADFINEEQLLRELGVRVPGEHPHGWE